MILSGIANIHIMVKKKTLVVLLKEDSLDFFLWSQYKHETCINLLT